MFAGAWRRLAFARYAAAFLSAFPRAATSSKRASVHLVSRREAQINLAIDRRRRTSDEHDRANFARARSSSAHPPRPLRGLGLRHVPIAASARALDGDSPTT